MNQPTPNPEPSIAAPAPAAELPDHRGTEAYRAGLERAMTLIWQAKTKLSVVTAEYFVLKNVWEELYHEANPKAEDGKH